MIIFKGFQGLEDFYIKFKDFPDFSRICMNPVNVTSWSSSVGEEHFQFSCCSCCCKCIIGSSWLHMHRYSTHYVFINVKRTKNFLTVYYKHAGWFFAKFNVHFHTRKSYLANCLASILTHDKQCNQNKSPKTNDNVKLTNQSIHPPHNVIRWHA